MPSPRPQPYIGVSGVINPGIESQLEQIATGTGLFDSERLLLLGVKAVHKTQYLDIENRFGIDWYPVGEEAFAGALRPRDDTDTASTLATAQVYFDPDYRGDTDYRQQFTRQIVRRGHTWLQALQFDMLPWHTDDTMLDYLAHTKEEFGLSVLLQCHKKAMETLGPKGVVRRLGHYATSMDYLLFDASHGTGTRLDTASLRPFVEEAYSSQLLDSTGIAIAGGLDATAVRDDLPELVNDFPDLSWDAEGKLHPATSHGRRPLDLAVTKGYLSASATVITDSALRHKIV